MGFQLVAVPLAASKAASRFRVVEPPTVEKSPPAYTVDPDIASAATVSSALGFQAASVPSELIAAKLPRGTDPNPIVLLLPPIYIFAPDTARA